MINNLRGLKIGTLLSIGIIGIISLMISASSYSTYLSNKSQNIIRTSTSRIFDVLTIQRDTEELFSALSDIDTIRDEKRLSDTKVRIDSLHERAIDTLGQGREREIFQENDVQNAYAVLDEVSEITKDILSLKEETINNIEKPEDNYDTNRDDVRDLDMKFNELRNVRFKMLGIFNDITMRSDEEYRGAMDLAYQSQRITWVVVGISLALAAFLGFFLVRSVKKVFDLKNEFVNIIAHDLRNPVTAILGYIEIITSDKNKKVGQILEHFQILSVSTQKLRSQINNLLEVGRTEAGRVKLNLEAVKPLEVIDESILRAKALAEISEIKIIYKKTEDKTISVLADRSKLSDILDNLISNAIKYNRKNGTVTISTESTDTHFRISVADTGHGIPDDKKDLIFKKYSRLQTDKQKGVTGTGLGLYTVKLSMDKMKGTASFESKEDVGTTFTVSLNRVSKNVPSKKDKSES